MEISSDQQLLAVPASYVGKYIRLILIQQFIIPFRQYIIFLSQRNQLPVIGEYGLGILPLAGGMFFTINTLFCFQIKSLVKRRILDWTVCIVQDVCIVQTICTVSIAGIVFNLIHYFRKELDYFI